MFCRCRHFKNESALTSFTVRHQHSSPERFQLLADTQDIFRIPAQAFNSATYSSTSPENGICKPSRSFAGRNQPFPLAFQFLNDAPQL